MNWTLLSIGIAVYLFLSLVFISRRHKEMDITIFEGISALVFGAIFLFFEFVVGVCIWFGNIVILKQKKKKVIQNAP